MKEDEEIMSDKEENKQGKCEVGEDSTKYGEFISSYFAWVPLPEQKRKADELDKMTKNKEKHRK